jgi:hypothetical protein
MEDSKFIPRFASVGWDAPWVYVQSDPCSRCDLYHRVFYNVLDHIHSFCRSCWKVVVRPQNLIQLFDLYELQKTMGVPCKCGMELRSTVEGLYGGYFYTRSKEEGLERYKEVRELVDEYLGKDVPVILKRYCTEFELGGQSGVKGQGPSNLILEVTDEEKKMEEYIESHFPQIGLNNPQPKHLIASVMKRWIHHAFEHGDMTYKEFTNGEKLTKDYVFYHNEVENKEGEEKDGFDS